MRKLMADCLTGVYEVEDFEKGVEVTKNEDMFFEELSQCDDDEQLACEVSDEMYETIKEKFGIKSL
jgi:hypothetical protein